MSNRPSSSKQNDSTSKKLKQQALAQPDAIHEELSEEELVKITGGFGMGPEEGRPDFGPHGMHHGKMHPDGMPGGGRPDGRMRGGRPDGRMPGGPMAGGPMAGGPMADGGMADGGAGS